MKVVLNGRKQFKVVGGVPEAVGDDVVGKGGEGDEVGETLEGADAGAFEVKELFDVTEKRFDAPTKAIAHGCILVTFAVGVIKEAVRLAFVV